LPILLRISTATWGDLAIPEPAETINATYNFQGSVDQKQQGVLEGEEVDITSEALATPPTPGIEPAPPTGESSPALRPGISLQYGSETSFTAVGKQVADDDMSLNERPVDSLLDGNGGPRPFSPATRTRVNNTWDTWEAMSSSLRSVHSYVLFRGVGGSSGI